MMQDMTFVILGAPRTKKNSQKIITIRGYPKIVPSKDYTSYRAASMKQIKGSLKAKIASPVNVKCLYYMPTRRRVDLVNLLEATCDILTDAEVIEDDNCKIVASHDGSRVLYDKENPRVEVTIGDVMP